MGHAAAVSRGARAFLLAGAAFLVAATAAAALDLPRGTVLGLALYGFVLHTVFGKAYSLLPAYFDRELASSRAPRLQLPLSAAGALAISIASIDSVGPIDVAGPLAGTDVAAVGAVLWAAGAGVFLATIAWTIRDNLAGAETGTGESKAERARADRIANAAMPVALGYLAIGAYETAAVTAEGPSLTGSRLVASHLLAVGTAALLVFAVGARLLPRLLRASVSTRLLAVVLASGSFGPALLVAWFAGGVGPIAPDGFLHGAAATLALAVGGHAAVVALLYRRAPSPRLGTYGVLAGAGFGVLTVAAGAAVGLGWLPELYSVHPRLGLLGFLGLTIVGVAYHFYPPAVAGAYGERLAGTSILLLAAGLLVELIAVVAAGQDVLAEPGLVVSAGQVVATGGALAYAALLVLTFRARSARG